MDTKQSFKFSFSTTLMVFVSAGVLLACILIFALGFFIGKGSHEDHEDRLAGVESEALEETETLWKEEVAPKMKEELEQDHSELDLTFYKTLLKKESPSLIESDEKDESHFLGRPQEKSGQEVGEEEVPEAIGKEDASKRGEKKLAVKKAVKADIPPEIPVKEIARKEKEETESLKGYTLQVGSFQEKDKAKNLADTLSEKGYSVHIASTTIPTKGIWHRVRIGHFKSFQEAKKFAKSVEMKERLPVFVTFVSK